MERTDILALMGELKLYGMRTAYDEVMAAGIKRQHEPPRIVGNLLKAEIAEKQARSIKQHKAQTASDRTSCRSPLANQFRPFCTPPPTGCCTICALARHLGTLCSKASSQPFACGS